MRPARRSAHPGAAAQAGAHCKRKQKKGNENVSRLRPLARFAAARGKAGRNGSGPPAPGVLPWCMSWLHCRSQLSIDVGSAHTRQDLPALDPVNGMRKFKHSTVLVP